MTSKFWGWLTLLIAAFVFVAVLTHASGFSLAAGTLFSGFNSLGQTLETGGTPATTSKKKG